MPGIPVMSRCIAGIQLDCPLIFLLGGGPIPAIKIECESERGVGLAEAIELNPGYATAHHWYAWHLLVMGRNSEGIFELRRAESLDPLSLIISADLADALCIAHLYDESVQQSKKTLEMDPNFAVAHYQLGQAFEQKRMHDEAIAEFQRATELSGHSRAFDSNLAYVYAVSEIGRASCRERV